MPQYNRQRQKALELVIYQLKRSMGVGPLDIYKFNGTTTNLQTGARTVSRTKVRIPLAVPMSTRAERRQVQTISKIGAAKDFVYGGYYDRDTKVFLVDARELTFELNQDDWFIFDDDKFQINKFIEWDPTLYVIVGQRQKGDTFSQIHEEKARDVIFLGEVASGS